MLNVSKDKSKVSSFPLSSGLNFCMVVRPCPRASRERIPAAGMAFRISVAKHAKERPEEPAPWWVTNRGPEEVGGEKYA